MNPLRVYQLEFGSMVKVGRPYTEMYKALQFASSLTAPQVEIRRDNWLEAIKIKGAMVVVSEFSV